MKRITHIDTHVGNRIKMQRMLKGLSQEKLGAATGVSFQMQQKRERGTNRVSAGALYKIAAELHVPIGVFFEGLEAIPSNGGSSDPIQECAATKDGLELMQTFNKIENQDRRRYLVGLAKLFAQ